jgi:hypothetical protein
MAGTGCATAASRRSQTDRGEQGRSASGQDRRLATENAFRHRSPRVLDLRESSVVVWHRSCFVGRQCQVATAFCPYLAETVLSPKLLVFVAFVNAC